ncbi:MAG: LLM class flavin-dependent oxidoreductase [Candidatus Tectomicrobia bacterium]
MHERLRCGVAFFPPNWVDLELATYAESLQFDALWIGEHIAFHVPTFDALITMAAVAARTTRIDIGVAAVLLPLRPAAALAKAATTLDIISAGRLRLGVGVGGEFPKEFEAVGVPLAERGRRADEAIAILRALWAPGSASYQGRFVQFEDVRMEPKPVQPGGPPILVGGRSERAIRRAATVGDGFMPYLYTPEQYAEARQRLLQYGADAGRPAADFTVPMYQFIYAAASDNEARDILATRLQQVYQQPFARVVERYCTAGTPETCRAHLQAYVDAGVREFILTPPVVSPHEFRQQLDLYATEILPALQV